MLDLVKDWRIYDAHRLHRAVRGRGGRLPHMGGVVSHFHNPYTSRCDICGEYSDACGSYATQKCTIFNYFLDDEGRSTIAKFLKDLPDGMWITVTVDGGTI